MAFLAQAIPNSTASTPSLPRTFTISDVGDLDVWPTRNNNRPFPPGSNPYTKFISGHVYDTNGAPVSGATVLLFRQSDNYMCATQLSGVQGEYLFPRPGFDTFEYFTLAYSIAGGMTQVHGTSDRGLVAE